MASQLQSLGFGSGIVYAYPVGGQLGTDPTPVEVGTVQNVKLTISADIKELFGLNQFPVDSAIGKRTIKGTVEYGQISGAMINNLIFGSGGTVTTGSTPTSYREAWTIPAATPYTVTVTNGATFVADGGVIYTATGQPLLNVGSGSLAGAGQYKVNESTGLYTFDVADEGNKVLITYSYTMAEDNQTFTVVNTPMGSGPILALQLPMPYESPSLGQLDRGIFLPNVRFGKLDWATKLDDYTMYNSDFSAFVNPATNSPISFYLPW
jgi:hypothetical protein